MDNILKVTIHKIKSIGHGIMELPIENGVYAIVGNNGVGKSTIIYSLAQLINIESLSSFGIGYGDGDSFVEFEYKGTTNKWRILKDKTNSEKIFLPTPRKQILMKGMYEGSLFFGFRFKNYDKVKKLISDNKIKSDIISSADIYIIEHLGLILHGNKNYYKSSEIVRLNKDTAKSMDLNETPYFMKIGNSYVSQYDMSSGESLMLSLLHFIYFSIEVHQLNRNKPVLLLIDEIELALHPVAVSRLLDLLNELVKKRSNLTIYITSHSPDVIANIKPRNIFKIDVDNNNQANTLIITNPCYPSYAIRDVYKHDGYDWLLLVEDDLSKIVVDNILFENNLNESRLIHVTPAGGWDNVLKLHTDLVHNNVLGVGKEIISILDGDIETKCNNIEKYQHLKKTFLPILSIEKYLRNTLIDNKNQTVYRKINDNFFQLKSLDFIIREYQNNSSANDDNGKKLYANILKEIEKNNINEKQFISQLANIIKDNVNFNAFIKSITKLLEK